MVCGRIRAGKAFRRYYPIVSRWRDAQHVILTIPNVARLALAGAIDAMFVATSHVTRTMLRVHGVRLEALRKLENTHNPAPLDGVREMHPHFHFVVKTARMATLMVDLWLAAFPDAVRCAQKIVPADATVVHELFKYFTKLVAKRGHADGSTATELADPDALDIMFRAMRRRRVFQPIGFKGLAVDEEEPIPDDEIEAGIRTRLGEPGTAWYWSQDRLDWLNAAGVALAGHDPGNRFRELVEGYGRGPP